MIDALMNEIKSWWYVFMGLLYFGIAMIFGGFIVNMMNKIKNIIFGGDKDV